MRPGTLTARRLRATAEIPEAATRYLYWWLLLAIVVEYARPVAFVPALGMIKLQSLVPVSLVVASFFAKGQRSWQEIFRDPLAKWVLIYLFIITFSIFTADLPLRSLDVAKIVLGYVLLCFVIVRIATTADRIRGICATLAFAHLFLLVMNPELILNPSQRIPIQGGSFLGDGNDFSLSLCILLPMTIDLALATKKRVWRLIWWSVLVLFALAIIASSSRGATLAMISIGSYLWVRSPRKLLTLAGIAMVGLLLLAYAPDTYFDRMSSIGNYQEDGSAMGRITAWKAGVRMFNDNPLFGVSAGNFPFAYGAKYRPPDAGSMAWLTAHSMYFLVLGELALPGIITLFMLLLGGMRAHALLQRQLRIRAAAAPALQRDTLLESERMLYLQNASLIGFAVAAAFLSVAYYPHIFVLTALMISARCVASRAQESSGLSSKVTERAHPNPRRRALSRNRIKGTTQRSSPGS